MLKTNISPKEKYWSSYFLDFYFLMFCLLAGFVLFFLYMCTFGCFWSISFFAIVSLIFLLLCLFVKFFGRHKRQGPKDKNLNDCL